MKVRGDIGQRTIPEERDIRVHSRRGAITDDGSIFLCLITGRCDTDEQVECRQSSLHLALWSTCDEEWTSRVAYQRKT